MLSELLTSNTRAEILRVLFDGQHDERYLRELEKLCKASLTSLQKEIKSLTELDLVKARKDGNRVYYTANVDHPLYPELEKIVEKTVGVVGQLQLRLKDERISHAFIFGSFAKSEEKAHSDVDLLVVGDISMRALTKLLSGLQEKINREINPHIYTREDFEKKIEVKDHFLLSIMKTEKKNLKGDIGELERIYSERVA